MLSPAPDLARRSTSASVRGNEGFSPRWQVHIPACVPANDWAVVLDCKPMAGNEGQMKLIARVMLWLMPSLGSEYDYSKNDLRVLRSSGQIKFPKE